MARLGDFIEQIRGVSYKPDDICNQSDSDAIAILRANNIQDDGLNFDDLVYVKSKKVSSNQLIKKGDIVVCASSGSKHLVGKASIAKKDLAMSFGAFCKVVRAKNILPEYLGHYFQSPAYRNLISHLAGGANINNIRNEHIDELSITIPDVEKQKEISKKLDKISDLISYRREQLYKLDELVKARFVELFGDIKTGNYKFETRKLGKVAQVGSSHRVFTTEFVEEGVPFYRGTEIGELANGIKPENPYRITKEHYDRLSCDETKPKIGDLLMPSICNKGQVWMVDTDEPFYYKDGRVLCISPNRKLFNCKYLEQFMREKTLVEYTKLGSGSTFAEFKIFLLKDIDILIPPIELQNEFATFVEQVDKSKFAVQQSLDKLETLKKSLMQQYFG